MTMTRKSRRCRILEVKSVVYKLRSLLKVCEKAQHQHLSDESITNRFVTEGNYASEQFRDARKLFQPFDWLLIRERGGVQIEKWPQIITSAIFLNR